MQKQEQPRDESSDGEGFFGDNHQQDEGSKPKEQQPDSENFRTKKKKHIRKRQKNTNIPKIKKEKNHKDLALKQAAHDIAKEIIEEMDKRYEQDLKLYGKKPANRKLLYLPTLQKQLRKVFVCQQFLQLNGLVLFEKWLRKLPDGLEPHLTLRIKLFQILEFLKVRQDHIGKAQQLQRIIQRQKKSQTKEMRDLSEAIISKWSKITYDDINE